MPKKLAKQYENKPAVSTNLDMVICVPLDCIPQDSALPCPFYVKVNDQFIFFRKAGDMVSEKRATSLTEKMADVVYLHKTHWVDFLLPLETKHLVSEESARARLNTRHLCLLYLKDIEEKHELFRHELKRYVQAFDRLAFVIDSAPESAASLIRRYHDVSIFYANHSVNVALYALVIGKKLGMKLEELKTLCLSALFHNLGNLKVPAAILHQPTQLSPSDLNAFRMHTLNGAELLSKHKVPEAVVRVAAEHHENFNGSGYPSGMHGNQISLFARICGLAAAYDELQSPTWKEPQDFKSAQNTLKQHSGNFDSKLLEILLGLNF